MQSHIELRGAGTNNLKSIDVSFPLNKMTVVTGVSGSGKSSLVFDTLYAEAYRRYISSLSSFARQYLNVLEKPTLLGVENLPAAVAVRQSRAGGGNRSTVGTATEVTDLLRVVFAHGSKIVCFGCGRSIAKETSESVTKLCFRQFLGEKVLVLAPLDAVKGLPSAELKAQLAGQGFLRVLVRDSVARIDDIEPSQLVSASVVVDRLLIEPDQRSRLLEAVSIALRLARGKVFIRSEKSGVHQFSSALECLHCGISFQEPSVALLSFNHPLGACKKCQGYGNQHEVDWSKVFPDHESSIKGKGIAPLNFGKHTAYYTKIMNFAAKRGLAITKPFSHYTSDEWAWLQMGDGKKFPGILGYFAWLDTKKYKPHYRMHAARFKRYVVCQACRGQRLSPLALACKIGGMSLADVCRLSLTELEGWIVRLDNEARDGDEAGANKEVSEGEIGFAEAIAEARSRLSYLRRVGVAYLTLDRTAPSLSGGELQRINMARCLGSLLTDTLYCLDEPTSGLHVRDSKNLLAVIEELRDQGNTVVVVEHERSLIEGADWLIEIGPDSGHQGGRVEFSGVPKEHRSHLGTESTWPWSTEEASEFFEVSDVSTHNLKGIAARFPVRGLTVVCGVSGSGKTSLIQHSLYPALLKFFGSEGEPRDTDQESFCRLGPDNLLSRFFGVVLVSQSSISRSTRSNIATYLGIYDHVRKLFSEQPLAVKRGLLPGAFSFNVPGGRCETCRGLGTIEEDMSFLGVMSVKCPVCEGRCFNDAVLEVDLRGKNLKDVLNLTVSEAREFFFDHGKIRMILDSVIRLGLGYLTLGQHTSSFSGGEAQRLKLLRLLTDAPDAKPSILIFDEPTTGLSDRDVLNLLNQFRQLTSAGHAVIVVEHHLGLIRSADWLIEIGPEAAEAGGRVVFQGCPRDLSACTESITGRFL